MTQARSAIVKDGVEGIYHCISRCVRRAFLCGRDPVTKKDYNHRKRWLYLRLIELADIFLIDVCGFAIMDNHLHVILRNRPDLSGSCSDQEIANRWWRLFPKRRNHLNQPETPTDFELECILGSESRVAELRKRLASISWFMRCLKENIAKKANEEDACTGRFWEGRFKSIALLDQAAVLTCTAYVDLNPIRAGLAKTPEASDFTSAKERILDRKDRRDKDLVKIKGAEFSHKNHRFHRHGGWLCPFKSEGHRKGFLQIELEDYLKLLDWTGRQMSEGKHGTIPQNLAPILTRLDINQKQWLYSSRKFGTLFNRVAGNVSSMKKKAVEIGQKWLKGKGVGKAVFLQRA